MVFIYEESSPGVWLTSLDHSIACVHAFGFSGRRTVNDSACWQSQETRRSWNSRQSLSRWPVKIETLFRPPWGNRSGVLQELEGLSEMYDESPTTLPHDNLINWWQGEQIQRLVQGIWFILGMFEQGNKCICAVPFHWPSHFNTSRFAIPFCARAAEAELLRLDD